MPGRTRPRWRIDPRQVAGRSVRVRQGLTSTVAGPLGGSLEIPAESEPQRTAVWKAAAQLVPKLVGWYVPWFDATRGSWARMEPDFVARVRLSDSDARDRFLVIEFKGMKAGEPSEVAKQNYLETRWVPAVSRPSPGGDDYGEWRAVWIERVEEARDAITRACRGA